MSKTPQYLFAVLLFVTVISWVAYARVSWSETTNENRIILEQFVQANVNLYSTVHAYEHLSETVAAGVDWHIPYATAVASIEAGKATAKAEDRTVEQ